MKQISALAIVPLLLCRIFIPAGSTAEKTRGLPVFPVEKGLFKTQAGLFNARPLTDTSAWFDKVKHDLVNRQYAINKCGENYSSYNPAQGISSEYHANILYVNKQVNSAGLLAIQTTGIFSAGIKLADFKAKPVVMQNPAGIDYVYGNGVTIQYQNDVSGVRQNYIIAKPLSKAGKLQVELQLNDGWKIVQHSASELAFQPASGQANTVRFNSLKAWDASGKPLAASFSRHDRATAAICVDATDAVYPVTIDPLSSVPDAVLAGPAQADALAGWSVGSAGDVNGDGYSDVAVGAPGFDGASIDEGRVYVYYGSAAGLATTPAVTLQDGTQLNGRFGTHVSTAGDVNADGYSDLLVSTPYFDDGSSLNEGRTFLYYGSAAGLQTTPMVLDNGNQQGAFFGNSIACAGDLNADGFSDIIIGAEFYDNGGNTDEGFAFVYHGSAAGLISTPATVLSAAAQAGAFFGSSVAGAGDFNGDGYSDVLVGASNYDANGKTNNGRAFIYFGTPVGLLGAPGFAIAGPLENEAHFGESVSSAGDVNGDGFSELMIGAPNFDLGTHINEGGVFFYYGSNVGLKPDPDFILLDTDQPEANFGAYIACAGDVNGDGYSDVMIGAPNFDDQVNTDEGRAYVHFGHKEGLFTSPGALLDDVNQKDAYTGFGLASAGDVNGDGYSDVIAGAYGYKNASNIKTGAAVVYYGAPVQLRLPAVPVVFNMMGTGDHLGQALQAGGDINGDGYGDVIFSAPAFTNGSNASEGRVFVCFGKATGLDLLNPVALTAANQSMAYFGYRTAAGDVNGDGYDDVIVGVRGYSTMAHTEEGRVYVFYGNSGGIATTPGAVLEGAAENGAHLGESVAAADINGDGFADVAAGAPGAKVGANLHEGKMFVYYGAATGIQTTAGKVITGAAQAEAYFGTSIANAGDVNGDGYTDLLTGTPAFDHATNVDAGKAWLYYGSDTGLRSASPFTIDGPMQADGKFAYSLSSAGDINGDGFADIIIGAISYSNSPMVRDGAVYIYYGSLTGINAAANIVLKDGGQTGAAFGSSVACAGDLDGDGYSDLVIGSRGFDNGANADEGKASLYFGSAAGLALTERVITAANQAGAGFGTFVSSAGDVNGDGYSDLVAGAPQKNGAATEEGAAYLYYGNNGTADTRNNVRLYNTDLATPKSAGILAQPNFGAGLFARSFMGQQKMKLVWQTRRNGVAFSNPLNAAGTSGQQANLTLSAFTGGEYKALVNKTSSKATYVRVRVKYDGATAITGQLYGPWRYPEGYAINQANGVLPVRITLFTGIAGNGCGNLSWITASDETGNMYTLERSVDGIAFEPVYNVAATGTGRQVYTYTDKQISASRYYYRLKVRERTGITATTHIVVINFDKPAAVQVYPTLIHGMQNIFVSGITATGKASLMVTDQSGRVVMQRQVTLQPQLQVQIPALPKARYYIKMVQGNHVHCTASFVVM